MPWGGGRREGFPVAEPCLSLSLSLYFSVSPSLSLLLGLCGFVEGRATGGRREGDGDGRVIAERREGDGRATGRRREGDGRATGEPYGMMEKRREGDGKATGG